MRSSLTLAAACAGLVFLVTIHFALCYLMSLSAPDARHHGWYEPQGELLSGLVLLVILHLALCFLPCCRLAPGARIMAGMDQKEGYVVPCGKLRNIRSCSSSRSFCSWRYAEAVPMVSQTIEIPSCWTRSLMSLLCRSCGSTGRSSHRRGAAAFHGQTVRGMKAIHTVR